ncbi:MAG: cobalt ECF transporter T component CbiQ, partial [Chloroflexota bacterium]
SFIHRLDPRTKLVASLAFIIAVVLTPANNWRVFVFYFCIIAVLLILSKLPPFYILKRSLVIFPFVLLIAIFIPFFKEGEIAGSYNIWLWQVSVTYSGLFILANVIVKAWLCILTLILLSSTTKLAELLKGLRQLGIPRVMILILSFMYRYIFVMADEVMRMQQARDSRNFGGKRLYQLKTIGNMVGTLFIRSYERGERIYAAMLSRGFDGQVRTLQSLRFKSADAYFGAVFCLMLVFPCVIWW